MEHVTRIEGEERRRAAYVWSPSHGGLGELPDDDRPCCPLEELDARVRCSAAVRAALAGTNPESDVEVHAAAGRLRHTLRGGGLGHDLLYQLTVGGPDFQPNASCTQQLLLRMHFVPALVRRLCRLPAPNSGLRPSHLGLRAPGELFHCLACASFADLLDLFDQRAFVGLMLNTLATGARLRPVLEPMDLVYGLLLIDLLGIPTDVKSRFARDARSQMVASTRRDPRFHRLAQVVMAREHQRGGPRPAMHRIPFEFFREVVARGEAGLDQTFQNVPVDAALLAEATLLCPGPDRMDPRTRWRTLRLLRSELVKAVAQDRMDGQTLCLFLAAIKALGGRLDDGTEQVLVRERIQREVTRIMAHTEVQPKDWQSILFVLGADNLRRRL